MKKLSLILILNLFAFASFAQEVQKASVPLNAPQMQGRGQGGRAQMMNKNRGQGRGQMVAPQGRGQGRGQMVAPQGRGQGRGQMMTPQGRGQGRCIGQGQMPMQGRGRLI